MKNHLRRTAFLVLVGLYCGPLLAQDFDGDGKPDNIDNCPVIANPNQADQDVDGIGNVCDITQDMAMLPDLNADGSPEVAVVVPGAPRVALREASTGEFVSEIDFGPGSGCGVDPLALDMVTVPDMNTNGSPDIALLMYYLPSSATCPGQVRVSIRDSLSGSLIKNLWYGAQYEPIALRVVGDYSANGTVEIAVMGSDSTDAIRVQVQDASTGATLDNVFLGNQGLGKDFVAVSDTSGNGMPELGILSVLKGNDQVRMQVWDAVDATFQTNIWFGKVYQPHSMITMPDINGNGSDEIVAVGVDLITQNIRVQVRDSASAATHYNIWLGNTNQAVDIALINDINGNGFPDLAVLLKTPDGTGRVRVQDGLNGAFIRNLFFSAVENPAALAVIADYSGNGFEELAALGENAGMQHVQILDTSSGVQVYRLDVGSVAPPNADATLSALSLSAGTLTPAFDGNILSYEATVNVAEISVTPLASDAASSITVNGTPVVSSQPGPVIPLNLGLNGIVVTVTAADGDSTSTYNVIVRRLNNEATLASLSVSAGVLDPVFDPDQGSYSIVTTASSYSVTPTASDVNASITVNGSPVASGATYCCLSLNLGNNSLTIEVTAQDGATTQTYAVTIYRQSTEARLGSLSVSAGNLSPAFSANTYAYSLTVPVEADSTSVTAAPLNANATMTVNGIPFSGTSDAIALNTGDNVLTINVTAEDGITIQSYTVTITRLNDDAFLAGISFSAGELDQTFDPNVTSYTMTVSYPYTTVTPVASDPDAQIEVAGQIISSGSTSGNVDLNLGFNSFVVQVKSTDASSTRTYIVSVTRVINTDPSLEGLKTSAGSLTPIFAPTQYDYTVEAGFLATAIEVRPFANPTSTILLNGVPLSAGEESAPIPLTESSNVIVEIDVTAEDGVSTASYTLEITRQSADSFAQQAYFKASNTDAGDQFGRSVALHGDTMAVGAAYEDSAATGIDGDQIDNSARDAGAVYVFTRDSVGTWNQQAYIKASNTDVEDLFGNAVALHGDILAVGAYGEDSAATGINGDQANNSAGNSGAVYVFTRDSAGTWSQQAYVKASNTDEFDNFGRSVALHGDTLAVGANGENSTATGINGDQANNSTPNSGAVYVFTRDSAGTWSQQAYVKASNTDVQDQFGRSVALHDDTLAVGASLEGSSATGINSGEADNNSAPYSGAAYVFTRDDAGVWSQQAYVKASNTDAQDQFGCSVALHDDTLAVGALWEGSAASGINGDQADNSASAAGAVYVFSRDNAGSWSQQAYVKASNSSSSDLFGESIALNGDILAVSAYEENSAASGINGDQTDNSAYGAGAVYVFARDSAGNWSQWFYVKASNTDPGDQFGYSIAIRGDKLAVGAFAETSAVSGINADQADNSMENAGAVYVFR